jgi:hypothetical protein
MYNQWQIYMGVTWRQVPQVKKNLKKFMNLVFKFWFVAPLVFFDDSLTTETFSVHCLLLFLFLSHSRLAMPLQLEEEKKKEKEEGGIVAWREGRKRTKKRRREK